MDHSHLVPISRATPRCCTALGWKRGKTKIRSRGLNANNGAPTTHHAADGGRYEPGAGLEASPSFQRRQELDAGAIARPRERLWHPLAWPCALACTACTGLRQWPELAALGKGSVCCKDSFGSRSTPLDYHSFGCLLQSSPEVQRDLRAIRCIQMVISKNFGIA
eukprot:scaffold8109_cov110-Isochrysis_galbana.AAC.9